MNHKNVGVIYHQKHKDKSKTLFGGSPGSDIIYLVAGMCATEQFLRHSTNMLASKLSIAPA